MTMEVYAGSSDRKVYLEVPVTPLQSSMIVTLEKNGETVHEFSTVTFANNKYSVNVPFAYSQNEGELEVHWEFQYNEDNETFDYVSHTSVSIVRPYIPMSEVAAIIAGSDQDPEIIERGVRNLINAYCGQPFGLTRRLVEVAGRGDAALKLPEKLQSLYTVQRKGFTNKLYDTKETLGDRFLGEDTFHITGDGWYLSRRGFYGDGIKADNQSNYTVTGPIYNPFNHSNSSFSKSSVLIIDGDWGWPQVPEAVKEAARLLINDFACNDSIYRDRYVEAITSADWRLQFNSGAYSRTGNARADQLLSDYIIPRGWLVI